MTRRIFLTAGALMLSTPLAAQDAGGDAAAGETQFGRQCVVCHVIENDAGEVLAGSSGGAGPNLYGVVGATPGTQEDYAYSSALEAYGETGAVWDEETLPAFIQDPTGYLREALDDSRPRSKMSYRMRNEDDALDVYAYLATFSPEEVDETMEEAASGETSTEIAEADVVHDIVAGEEIYQGNCSNCHGRSAQGMASFPKLVGHDADYLETRLEQYRAGERVGPNSALMIPVARELSDADIDNVVAYITTTFE